MKKVEISQVILLHPIKFVCEAFEKFSKDLNIQTYTLDSYEKLDYLLEDLKPDVFIVHANILTGFAKQIQEDLEQSKADCKIIVWGKSEDIEEMNFTYHKAMIEPVDLGQLESIFSSLLAEIQ